MRRQDDRRVVQELAFTRFHAWLAVVLPVVALYLMIYTTIIR
jgi:hypothetical protein